MSNQKDRFCYESPQDSENQLNVYVVDGRLCISVADEKPVDSYNSTFTCDIHLPIKVAKKLRDFLNAKFPD